MKVWKFDSLMIDGGVEPAPSDMSGNPLADEITPDTISFRSSREARRRNRSLTKFVQSVVITLLFFVIWSSMLTILGIGSTSRDPWLHLDLIIYFLAPGMAGAWLLSVITAKIFGKL